VYENYIKAGNPETPADELRTLLTDENPAVRRRLAENPRTPEDILLTLAGDRDPEVRCAVAEHALTPRAVLEQLASDENVQVRYAVAGQYTLPLDLLEGLSASDENPYVRDHARRTLEGIFLEQALKEAGFVPRPGDGEKLGELLLEAGVVAEERLQELLRISREREMPLGRALVESRCVNRSVIVAALKAQNSVRNRHLTLEQAIYSIQHVLGKI
jgi:hypothetical protein